MKKASSLSLFLLGLCFTVLAHDGFSQDKGFGLGVILGEPTGISGKSWLNRRNAVDGGLAWSFRGEGSLHIHADYLWHFHDAIEASEKLVPFVGVGGRLATRGEAVFGVRIPVGLVWWPKQVPLDVFAEIVPIVDLAPATELRANAGVGVRFYFP